VGSGEEGAAADGVKDGFQCRKSSAEVRVTFGGVEDFSSEIFIRKRHLQLRKKLSEKIGPAQREQCGAEGGSNKGPNSTERRPQRSASRRWSQPLMPPIGFSDSEMDELLTLAQPLAPSQRGAFLKAVAELLAQQPERGPGIVHRLGVELQAQFRATPPSLRSFARSHGR
jgi:hypothetical protein